jgi:hypothetical protein
MAVDYVGQTFLSAGSGDFLVARIGAAFDIFIVQDQGEHNLSLVDFDRRAF